MSNKIGGHAIITDPAARGGKIEMDTFTCGHCSAIVFLHDPQTGMKRVEEGFCMPCFRRICVTCADKGLCVPFEKKLRESEEQGRSRRALDRELGR